MRDQSSLKHQNELAGWFLHPLDIFPQTFYLIINRDNEIHNALRFGNPQYFSYSGCTCSFENALGLGYKWSTDKKRWQEFGSPGKND